VAPPCSKIMCHIAGLESDRGLAGWLAGCFLVFGLGRLGAALRSSAHCRGYHSQSGHVCALSRLDLSCIYTKVGIGCIPGGVT
jgi:hypothetical protein